MRVGMLGPYVSHRAGGVFYAIEGLARALNGRADVDVELFGLEDSHTRSDTDAWTGLTVHASLAVGPEPFGYSPALLSSLYAAELDIHHAHGLWMYPSIASLRWAKRTGKPYVVSPHGMLDPWALRNSSLKKDIAGRLYESRHLHGAACLHALCESEAKAMRDYGLNNPICVIPNGVARPASSELPLPAWKRPLPDGSKTLLYLGRLHPKKGLSELLHAWGRVQGDDRSKASDWQLVIAGWGEDQYEKELRSLADTLNIGSKVCFAGPQFAEQKDASYACADAFILPSHSEGLPMVVLEAWTHCLPVLMTPFCNVPQGFSASAAIEIQATIESIGDGIEALASMDDAERIRMGECGRALVEQQFTWSRVAEEMCCVYKWVLGRGERPGSII